MQLNIIKCNYEIIWCSRHGPLSLMERGDKMLYIIWNCFELNRLKNKLGLF